MSAPKIPVATGLQSSRSKARTKASKRGAASSGGAAALYEGRPFACRRVERELAHGEHRSADLEERSIHHPGVIVEDTQVNDLVREPVAVAVAIGWADATQNQQSRSDRCHGLGADIDAGPRHALDYRPHE